ncbi:MAG: flagellar basal body protein, partial [Chloroflexota bacterium]
MPNLTSGIGISLSAVLAQSQALEVVEHNIANANTPGYRRQSAVLSANVMTPATGTEYGTVAG